MADKVVYADKTQKKFFHIPKDAELPAGTFVIRNLKGEKKETVEDALSAYAIPEAEAKAIVAEDLKKFAKNASEFLNKAATLVRSGTNPAYEGQRAKSEMTFAAALGMSPEQVRANPDQAFEALKATLMGMATTLRDAARTDDPESKRDAQGRMKAIAQHIAAVGGPEYSGTVEELPDKIRAFLSDPRLEKEIRDNAQRLTDLAAELRVEAQTGKDRTE